jgi:toxin FitB
MKWMSEQVEHKLYISAITLGEIQQGVSALPSSAKRTKLQAWLDGDLRARFSGRVLVTSDDVCLAWGNIRAEAAKRGKTLPVLDALIAATALTHQLTLVTRNVGDFKVVAGLKLINPWS